MNNSLWLLFLVLCIRLDASASGLMQRVQAFPDLMQTDRQAAFEDGGRYYCAPVAAADYLVWLAGAGFDGLCAEKLSTREQIIETARELAGAELMHATENGVPAWRFVEAVGRFARSKGYDVADSLAWSFQDYHASLRLSPGDVLPHLDKKGMVWLIVGKYHQPDSTGAMHGFAYHYISLVGYHYSEDGALQLLCVCSSPRSGKTPHVERLTITPMNAWSLHVPFMKNPVSAEGFWEITSGLAWAQPGERLVIHGYAAVRLTEK